MMDLKNLIGFAEQAARLIATARTTMTTIRATVARDFPGDLAAFDAAVASARAPWQEAADAAAADTPPGVA